MPNWSPSRLPPPAVAAAAACGRGIAGDQAVRDGQYPVAADPAARQVGADRGSEAASG